MVDADGHPVGRLADVVLDELTSEPAWGSVDCHLCAGVELFVPLARARVLDGRVRLPYTAADLCGAPRAERPTGRLDSRQAEELRRYYAGLDDGAPVAPPPHDAERTIAPAPPSFGGPAVAANGHRRLDGRSARVPPVDGGPDNLPVRAGPAVRTGHDAVVAYPATSSGPWSPLATSSPGPPWWQRRQWRWPSVPTSLRPMRVELRPLLDMSGLPVGEREDLVLAAGEAAANAVEHARLSALPFFDILAEVGERRARIVVQDHGLWHSASDGGGHRGRGLQMIGALADATLTVGPKGTTVILCNRPQHSD